MNARQSVGGIALGLLLCVPFFAHAAFEAPVNDGFVTDAVGLLTEDQDTSLEADLTAYRTTTSNEIAVLIVRSLSGSDVSEVATDIGRKWGVGSSKDNGILILISYDEHDIWIATGYGLEGAVPDIVAHGIAQKDMAPEFRDGNYYEGIVAGIDALKKHIGGEYTADRYAENSESDGGYSLELRHSLHM